MFGNAPWTHTGVCQQCDGGKVEREGEDRGDLLERAALGSGFAGIRWGSGCRYYPIVVMADCRSTADDVCRAFSVAVLEAVTLDSIDSTGPVVTFDDIGGQETAKRELEALEFICKREK